jgi:hypothetical protein
MDESKQRRTSQINDGRVKAKAATYKTRGHARTTSRNNSKEQKPQTTEKTIISPPEDKWSLAHKAGLPNADQTDPHTHTPRTALTHTHFKTPHHLERKVKTKTMGREKRKKKEGRTNHVRLGVSIVFFNPTASCVYKKTEPPIFIFSFLEVFLASLLFRRVFSALLLLSSSFIRG